MLNYLFIRVDWRGSADDVLCAAAMNLSRLTPHMSPRWGFRRMAIPHGYKHDAPLGLNTWQFRMA